MPRSLLLLVSLAACSTLDTDRPAAWLESAILDLYFVGQVPDGTVTAGAAFATAPLNRQDFAPDFEIHLAAFHDVGDNVYESTLNYTGLGDPIEGETHWLWAGSMALVGRGYGTPWIVGVHVRGLPYEAVRVDPLVHLHCQIDLLGQGVIDCGLWADALYSGKALCRGVVGQLIGCHGIGYEIVPDIGLFGIGRQSGEVHMDDNQPQGEFTYFVIHGVTFTNGMDGWRYAETARPQPQAGAPPLAPPTYHGPFQSAEAAAIDASERLGRHLEVPNWAASWMGAQGRGDIKEAIRAEVAKRKRQ